MRFFLGTHHPHWLADARFAGVPLFVSRRALARYKATPRAVTPWALDSGGFTELSMHGQWTLSPRDYVAEVRRYRDEIGMLEWAAPQDWMCETVMLAKTGLSIPEHQRRTVANLLDLRSLAPDLPFIPVLQGWTSGDYHAHAEAYDRAGVDLRVEPVVGVGTVCRRQNTMSAALLMHSLQREGLRLHGFGFKATGLAMCRASMVSSDSLAWSYAARRQQPIQGHNKPGPGRPRGHINCANCAEFAMDWRNDMLAKLESRHAA